MINLYGFNHVTLEERLLVHICGFLQDLIPRSSKVDGFYLNNFPYKDTMPVERTINKIIIL